jgi:hypothetical protein
VQQSIGKFPLFEKKVAIGKFKIICIAAGSHHFYDVPAPRKKTLSIQLS